MCAPHADRHHGPPTIGMFYGIVVPLFFKDKVRHHEPHIHVRHRGMSASVSIRDGTTLDGDFPVRRMKLVAAWIELHRDELDADRQLAAAGEERFRIAPPHIGGSDGNAYRCRGRNASTGPHAGA